MDKLIYANKDDPRVFVYNGENIAWGVSLNFAHKKAWVIMLVTLLVTIVPVMGAIMVDSARSGSVGLMLPLLIVVYGISVVAIIGVMSFRGAARDLKRYPGPKGPRAQKGRWAAAFE